jgi:hypothetical protein
VARAFRIIQFLGRPSSAIRLKKKKIIIIIIIILNSLYEAILYIDIVMGFLGL